MRVSPTGLRLLSGSISDMLLCPGSAFLEALTAREGGVGIDDKRPLSPLNVKLLGGLPSSS